MINAVEEKILQELADIKLMLEENKRIMTVDQAARFLNMKKSYLYKIINTIPHSQPNEGRIYFDREDLIKWAMSAKKLPPAEQAEHSYEEKSLIVEAPNFGQTPAHVIDNRNFLPFLEESHEFKSDLGEFP